MTTLTYVPGRDGKTGPFQKVLVTFYDSSDQELFAGTAFPGIVKVTDGTGIASLDKATNVLNTISYSHHEIHSGSHFFVRRYYDIPNGGTYEYLITTPNTTKWAHLTIAVNNELETEYDLREGVTVVSGGTAIPVLNRDRNNAGTATTLIKYGPINVTSGTTIARSRLGSGRSFGGAIRDNEEIILKQNTNYHFIITNRSGSADSLTNITFDWYEHTNKNV